MVCDVDTSGEDRGMDGGGGGGGGAGPGDLAWRGGEEAVDAAGDDGVEEEADLREAEHDGVHLVRREAEDARGRERDDVGGAREAAHEGHLADAAAGPDARHLDAAPAVAARDEDAERARADDVERAVGDVALADEALAAREAALRGDAAREHADLLVRERAERAALRQALHEERPVVQRAQHRRLAPLRPPKEARHRHRRSSRLCCVRHPLCIRCCSFSSSSSTVTISG